jgi:hypothetical protein
MPTPPAPTPPLAPTPPPKPGKGEGPVIEGIAGGLLMAAAAAMLLRRRMGSRDNAAATSKEHMLKTRLLSPQGGDGSAAGSSSSSSSSSSSTSSATAIVSIGGDGDDDDHDDDDAPGAVFGTGGFNPGIRTEAPCDAVAVARTIVGKTTDDARGGSAAVPLPPASGGSGGSGSDDDVDDVACAAPTFIVVFTSAELSRCTSKYTRILGHGSFGTVFGGTLPDGRRIAVKQLELAAKQKQKGKKKLGGRADPYAGKAGFRLELEVLSKYRHPHLVELIGYCVDKQLLRATKCNLVLEFMAEGSLLDRLRPDHVAPALAAQERFDIAADVARGLHYLHAEASPPLIHQDLKSDNVLLAEVGGRLIAKVADFGTARMAPQLAMNTTAVAPGGGGGKTHHSTTVIVGTRPYMPMEYIQMGRVSEKTDTFAYGVVLLELLTGKPPHDEEGGSNEALHSFAHDMLCDPIRRLVPLLDTRVATASWTSVDGATGELGGRALWLCLVAKRCLELAERARGTMREAMPKVIALAAQHEDDDER